MISRRALMLGLSIGSLLACFAGCHDERPAADATYTVRGQVVAITATEVRVHHEAIPGFVGRNGAVVGMDSMTMPFHLAEGVDTHGIEDGDPVDLTFEVRWDADEALTATAIHELPAGTPLTLE